MKNLINIYYSIDKSTYKDFNLRKYYISNYCGDAFKIFRIGFGTSFDKEKEEIANDLGLDLKHINFKKRGSK